jgi:hypothetical protein
MAGTVVSAGQASAATCPWMKMVTGTGQAMGRELVE